MPINENTAHIKVRKVPRRNCYTVFNRGTKKNKTSKKYSKCTSRAKALRQRRLLYAIRFGNFKPRQ